MRMKYQLLQLPASELNVEMLRPGGVSGEERKVDISAGRRRELALGLLGSLAQALDYKPILKAEKEGQ
jgi:hypothetical protein